MMSLLPQPPSKEVEPSSVAEDDQEILALVQSLSHEELIIMATKERKTRVRYRKKCLQVRTGCGVWGGGVLSVRWCAECGVVVC